MRQQAPGAGEVQESIELEDTLTESSPLATPRYSDERWRDLGERLAALYEARDEASGEERERIEQELAVVRGRMRRGPRLHAGEFLADGRYRLLQRLSRDAASARWLAWERPAGRTVLLDVLHAGWVDDDDQVETFAKRGERLRAVDHPRVARVLEAARSEEGFVYIASRFCGAADLQQAVGAEDFTATDAVQVALELAEALGAVHGEGLTHGALSPAAVLLSEDGAAHLAGFRVGPEGQAPTLYAAPESLSQAHEADPRGDVYSLGMTTLFALYRKELPFWVIRDAGRLVDELEVPDGVKEVLRAATSWDPEVRFADTGALGEALLADDGLVASLARRAYGRGRFAVAAAHYERLLTQRPAEAVRLRTRLGDVYLRLQAHDEAFAHLTIALEQAVAVGSTLEAEQAIGPQIKLLERQADLTGDHKRLADALDTLADKLEGPRQAVIRSHLARVQQERLEDLPAARSTWRRVLEGHHTPELARLALKNLSRLAERQEAWDDFIRHSIDLLPYLSPQERPRVQFNIGRACIEHTGDEDTGLGWIDQAEAGGLRTLELCERLEHLRARRGQWPRVIELMVRRATVLDAEQVSRLLLRAGFMARSVHLDGLALEVYQELLRRVPRHVVALRELARLHYRAREPKAALEYFEALHDGKAARTQLRPDEVEAGERAIDLLAHARLLLRAGRAEDALARLNEALACSGDLVPALQLIAPLQLARGRTEEAGRTWERLLALHGSLDEEPHRIGACIGLGDVAWVQGKLAMARGWYNRAIEADPNCAVAWWGIARTGLAARGGHPGLDRAPWLGATPLRVTPPEALARLLVTILDVDAMRAWLGRSPLGTSLLAGGDCPIRVALSVVDVLLYHGLVDRELFSRLIRARPGWKTRIDAVADQFFGVSDEVDEHGTYLGPAGAVSGDFDRAEPRMLLPWVGLDAIPALPGVPWGDEAWEALMEGAEPPAPDPEEGDTAPLALHPRHEASAVAALLREGRAWVVLEPDAQQVVVGSSSSADVRLQAAEAAAEQLVLYRVGDSVYLRAEPGVRVDGEPAQRRRLTGGEVLEVCGVQGEFVLRSELTDLPEAFEEPPDESEPTAIFRLPTEEELARAEEEAAEQVSGLGGLRSDLGDDEPPEEPQTERIGAPPSDFEGVEDEASEEAAAEADASDTPEEAVAEPESADPAADPAAEEAVAEPESPDAEAAAPTPEVSPEAPGEVAEQRVESSVEPEAAAPGSASDDPPDAEEASAAEPAAGQGPEVTEPPPEAVSTEGASSEGASAGEGAGPESVVERLAAEEASDPEDAGEAEALAEAAAEEAPETLAEQPTAPAEEAPAAAAESGGEAEAEGETAGPPGFLAPPETRGGVSSATLKEAATPEPARERPRQKKRKTPAPAPQRPREPTPNPAARHAELIRKRMRKVATYKPPVAAVDDEATIRTDVEVPEEPPPPPSPELRAEHPGITQVVAPPEPAPEAAATSSDGSATPPEAEAEAPEAEPPAPEAAAEAETQAAQDSEAPAPEAPTSGSAPGGGPDYAEQVTQIAAPPAPPPEAEGPSSGSDTLVPSQVDAEDEDEDEDEAPEPPRLAIRAVVEVMSGPARGVSAEVEELLRIGSAPDNELAIVGDGRLDAHHCTVVRTTEGFLLRDAGSGAGTVMNGTRVDADASLAGGEVIMVGRTVLRFRRVED